MKRLIIALSLLVPFLVQSQINQWGGPDRNGIFKGENLWQNTIGDKPELLLTISGIGWGYGSPTVTESGIYIAGMIDTTGYIFKFTHDGKELWKYAYGREFNQKYLGSRATPTIEGDRLYYFGTFGDVVCLNATNGKEIWKINTFETYGGKLIKWGNTESPLLFNDILITTPGGEEFTLVGLNKNDGTLIWKIDLPGTTNSYCSPVLVEHNQKTLALVTLSDKMVMFDPTNGEIYLTHPTNQRRETNPMPPFYQNGQLFFTSGYGLGSVMYAINDTDRRLEPLWQNPEFDCKMSGLFCVDGLIYGTSDQKKQWIAISWKTGETIFTTRELKPGSFIMADNKFILFTDDGEVAVATPNSNGFEINKRFRVPAERVTMAFAHPVLYKKRLYVRYNNELWIYDAG
jgi:outer membrane protein assembly factor BamB